MALFGRCLMEGSVELPCQALNISPADCAVACASQPHLHGRVVVYFDHIGRVEGDCIRLFDGGFAMSIEGTDRRREKLAARIKWLVETHEFGREDGRRHARLEPQNRNSEIRLKDGRSYPTEIIDISLSGAAVRSEVRPAIGAEVWLSGMSGKVVRHFAEGIAIEFAKMQEGEIS
ncbi:MAG: PilZ domain-containing protein [Pseudomonadota bacterium]